MKQKVSLVISIVHNPEVIICSFPVTCRFLIDFKEPVLQAQSVADPFQAVADHHAAVDPAGGSARLVY